MWKNLSAHAYLVVGDQALALKNLEIERGSPDFFSYTEALFGIDEARVLVEKASRKSFTGKKIFFIAPERITQEAQNALLKTFEEPTLDTQFFLVVRDESVILPTLKSRMQVLSGQSSALTREALKFLQLSIPKRFEFAKKFADDEENLSRFLDELLLTLRNSRSTDAKAMVDKEVYKMRLLSDDRSTSSRLILEHLSLMV